MVLKPLPGQRVFVVKEPGTGYAKGSAIETEVVKVTEGHERIKVELLNGLVLAREGEETKWHTEDLNFRTFVLLNNKPDLRYLRATHRFNDAHEAAVFFTQAAAVGGGEAPKEMLHFLKKGRVNNLGDLFQLARVANEKSRKHLPHRLIYHQNSFAFQDNGKDITSVVWQCLSPQCGYSAPPTRIAAKEEGGKIIIEVSGRPDGVWKRLKEGGDGLKFKIEELKL